MFLCPITGNVEGTSLKASISAKRELEQLSLSLQPDIIEAHSWVSVGLKEVLQKVDSFEVCLVFNNNNNNV